MSKLPRHPLAGLSMFLSILLLLLPVHVDLLASALHKYKNINFAIFVSVICIGIVLIPALVATWSILKIRKNKGLWGLTIVYILIFLNIIISYFTITATM